MISELGCLGGDKQRKGHRTFGSEGETAQADAGGGAQRGREHPEWDARTRGGGAEQPSSNVNGDADEGINRVSSWADSVFEPDARADAPAAVRLLQQRRTSAPPVDALAEPEARADAPAAGRVLWQQRKKCELASSPHAAGAGGAQRRSSDVGPGAGRRERAKSEVAFGRRRSSVLELVDHFDTIATLTASH